MSTRIFFNTNDSRHYSQKNAIQRQNQEKSTIVFNASSPEFSMFLLKLISKYCIECPWKTKTSW